MPVDDATTTDDYVADKRNFYKVERWSDGGSEPGDCEATRRMSNRVIRISASSRSLKFESLHGGLIWPPRMKVAKEESKHFQGGKPTAVTCSLEAATCGIIVIAHVSPIRTKAAATISAKRFISTSLS